MKRAFFYIAPLVLCAGLGFVLGHYFRPPSGPQNAAAKPAEASSHYPLSAPPLRLRTIKWDFPPSLPGQELTHRFEIANDTENPWTLKHIAPGCTCTVGTLSSKTVPPGETASLKVVYRTPLRDGKTSEHIMIEFAEPAGPVVQLTIEGEVRGQQPPAEDAGQ
ncbi:MAG TPA: DUF1573 domain-containing protein [Gemmataceae bacterium]